jgi:hypothetical protein
MHPWDLSCPSVCPHGLYQIGSHWVGFRDIWHCRISWKSVERIEIWLESKQNIGHLNTQVHCVVAGDITSSCKRSGWSGIGQLGQQTGINITRTWNKITLYVHGLSVFYNLHLTSCVKGFKLSHVLRFVGLKLLSHRIKNVKPYAFHLLQ